MGSKYDTDVAFIRALADLVRDSALTEIEVKREFGPDDALTVRVARQSAAPAPIPAPAQVTLPVPVAVTPALAATAEDPARHPGAVPSPMVGTVYLQPEPTMPAFVKLGDQVAEGQTLLIIEAMKTMNQIPAPRAGTVRRILVEDGSPVEFGSPLMIID